MNDERLKVLTLKEVAEALGMSYHQASRKIPKLKGFPPPITAQGHKKWRAGDVYDYRERV